MRILISGKNGQLASSFKAIQGQYDDEFIFFGRPEIDFEKPEQIYDAIINIAPDIIISAAAYTMVDKAEDEPEIAYKINAEAPEKMAMAAKQLNIPIIHISSDYVFSGDKADSWIETDETNPVNIYGKTKLEGEKLVIKANKNHVILRTSWVYSPFGNNFVKTMLRIGAEKSSINVVCNQTGCPSYAIDIATAIMKIAKILQNNDDAKYCGIFHLAAPNHTNWADFACEIFEFAKEYSFAPPIINKITSAEYKTPATRPKNSILNTQKLNDIYDIQLPKLQISLKNCVEILLNP